MRPSILLALGLFSSLLPLQAQFVEQQSHTTASLRGIDSLGGGVAWASGADGSVLRTLDDGRTWLPCAVPAGGARLDFRGIQGFDSETAVIMASGKGPASRIDKTTDGCKTWKTTFENPDAEGFFDALRKVTTKQMYLLGDPVGGKFAMFYSADAGSTWSIADDPGLEAEKADGAFAASNSALTILGNTLLFGSGGGSVAHVYETYGKCAEGASSTQLQCPLAWKRSDTPLAAGSAGAGVFSVSGRITMNQRGQMASVRVAVGGDYTRPGGTTGVAAWSRDEGKTWVLSEAQPHGYRSAVAFDVASQTWFAVGPNGVDRSVDDGRHWLPAGSADDMGWNAISLPFAVGAKGRIGRLPAGGIARKPR